MYTDLLNAFEQISPLQQEEADLICSSFKPIELNKGDFFLKEGTINRNIGFLSQGLVRYFVHKNGEESTFEFTKEGEFIGDYQSFRNSRISLQNIQAIENCKLLVIDYPSIQNLYQKAPHGNLIGRKIITHRFEIMVNQLLDVYMQNHEERYKSFMENYFDLSQRIPQYLIASYVGVRPESLSRIRKRVAF